MDFKAAYGDKKLLRGLSLAINGLVKLPSNIERSVQIINVSFNKLRSLNGLENCVNLKFLNLTGNSITSVHGIGLLQNLKELLLAYNQLSQIKEMGTLKNLSILDLSYNKIIDYDKISPLQQIKKLQYLNILGNNVFKLSNF